MNKNNLLLIVAGLLILFGLGNKLGIVNNVSDNNCSINLNLSPPTDPEIQKLTDVIIASFKAGSIDRKSDGIFLACLYNDMSNLIEEDSSVIKTTQELVQANSLAAKLLKINLKGKYPGFSEAATSLIMKIIGDDNVALDEKSREQAVNAFRYLAWACKSGAE